MSARLPGVQITGSGIVGAALKRSRATGNKIRRARTDGTLGAKLRRRVSNSLYVPLRSVVDERRLAPADRALDLGTGFVDHRGTERELRVSDHGLQRLVRAFAAAEAGRNECPPEMEIRGVWAEWLDLYYGNLRNLLRGGDVVGLRELLENVHRDPLSTGLGGTHDDTEQLPGPLARTYYRVLWCLGRDLLQTVRPDWRDVASPVVGNPRGAWIDGRLVYADTLRHAYYATILLETLSDHRAVRILEIGAGMGGQAFQLLTLGRGKITSYMILDLPEVACVSAYCLMASMGEEQVRLFGEEDLANTGVLVEVLPYWRMPGLEDRSADLIFNSYSFSEMDSSTANFYLHQIERLADLYFFHINHETRFRYRQPDGSISVNRIGSEMTPDPQQFQLLSRSAARFVRAENRANHAFEYLYRRTSTASSTR